MHFTNCILFIFRISSYNRNGRGTLTAMHYLHPRSRTTGTLFTGTLAVSFLYVALPHFLPCPLDRRHYADTIEMPDGMTKRRRRRAPETAAEEAAPAEEITCVTSESRPKRECPVPKPGGLVRQMMGFQQKAKEQPPQVVVRSLRSYGKMRQGDGDEAEGA